MKRDFSDEAKAKLLSLVDDVETEKWCDATDWIGDRFSDLKFAVGLLKLDDDLGNVDAFHKSIIDKNNMSKARIEEIFSNVRSIDQSYGTRFASLAAQVQSVKRIIDQAAMAVAPGNSSIDPVAMATLKNALAEYAAEREVYSKMAGDGITEEDLAELDDKVLQNSLSGIIANLSEHLPNIELGQTIELAIGVGLVVYYSVTGKTDGDSPIDVKAAIEDNRLKFQNFGVSTEAGDKLRVNSNAGSDGDFSVSINSDVASAEINQEGIEGSASVTIGDTTYTTKMSFGFDCELKYEESITSKLPGENSITSTIGIKKKVGDSPQWKPLPVRVAEPSPSYSFPEIDVDWEAVAIGVGITAFAAGLILAAPTGGASLVLCAA